MYPSIILHVYVYLYSQSHNAWLHVYICIRADLDPFTYTDMYCRIHACTDPPEHIIIDVYRLGYIYTYTIAYTLQIHRPIHACMHV